ncbi:hypothetical protein HanPSC8_Chr15g0651211 [Helianthus annuus]|nr:hypothetical protein HanPSC8_Chr15g0651211 [Helianthus annuus]
MKRLKPSKTSSTVHPSPSPPPPPPPIATHLALLPAAIFTLTLTLSPEDKEILAYLLSKKTTTAPTDHSPLFNCSCFRCYMSYWVRWDSSPNRHLIHQIIDAFEDGLFHNNKTKKHRKKKPPPPITTTTIIAPVNNNNNDNFSGSEGVVDGAESTRSMELSRLKLHEFESVKGEEGMVKRMVSFLGERIWSVWT